MSSRTNVEEAYYRGSKLFHLWVQLLELHTRRMELEDLPERGCRTLIIAAPTDGGIPLMAEACPAAETSLLCFSDRTGQIARRYCSRRGCGFVQVIVAPFFRVPSCESYFAAVYANCFLDFCTESELDAVIDEIWRILELGGSLFTVNMAEPTTLWARLWLWAIRRVSPAGRQLRPIDAATLLGRHGFHVLKCQSADRLGFPMSYVHAKKVAEPTGRDSPGDEASRSTGGAERSGDDL